MNVDMISVRQKYNCKEQEGTETIETGGLKLPLDALKFVHVGRRDGIPKYRGIFQLGPD
jgi:hypothetical protein